jgi:GTP-binding protein
VVVVNKLEDVTRGTSEFAVLGFAEMLPLSAEHGMGIGDLLDAVLVAIPRVEAEDETSAPRLAIVGRPNVGKSSLLNALLGTDRAVVSPIPGTTRDAVDSLLLRDGKRFLLVDTAGIRRVRHLKANVDHVSVVQARRALERADVAVLVLDTAEGVREMDATIGGYIHESSRGVVIAVNKWDLALSLGLKRKSFEADLRDELKFLAYAPIVFVSAIDGKGLANLLGTVERVFNASRTRVSTGLLNRELTRATERFPPKAAKGNRPLSVLYGTQVGVAPPTFVLSVNHPVDLHFSYRRYLENRLRKAFGFEGTPLVVKVRARRH